MLNGVVSFMMHLLKDTLDGHDDQGWRQSAPVSDRECIRQCLYNSIELAGLDKEQVKRLYLKYGGTLIIWFIRMLVLI